jgi:hypothetical protein
LFTKSSASCILVDAWCNIVRWYFAIDEKGTRGQAGQHARLAVLSARAIGGLEPVLLYTGARNEFCDWMTAQGVGVVDAAPAFLDAIEAAEASGTYISYSKGHWLRLVIPQIEQERDFVLYTDCDVFFLTPFDWQKLRPGVFAAAPEFAPENWNYFNSGVMLLNVQKMRETYPAFETLIRARIGATSYTYDDQVALNEAYRGSWDRLDPLANWKPYWGFAAKAAILHFHGPKLNELERIAAGTAQRGDAHGAQMANMLDSAVDGYIAWSNVLADRFQNLDFGFSYRCARLASALTEYRKTVPEVVDTSFRNFKLFAE